MKLARSMTLGHVDWKWRNLTWKKVFTWVKWMTTRNDMVISMKLNKHNETHCSSKIECMVEITA
jgi:hypothetical protein